MLLVNQLTGFGVRPQGSIRFVGAAATGKVGATSGNSTISLTSGLTGGISSSVANDDLVIAAFCTGSGSERNLIITDGANPYTLIGSELFSSDTQCTNLRVTYKFVSGDTATTFGPTTNSNDAGAMAVSVYRGVDKANPFDVTEVSAIGNNSPYPNAPAITPVTPGALVVVIGGASPFNVANLSASELSGYIHGRATDTYYANLGIGYYPWVSGAYDPAAFTFGASSDSRDSWAAMAVALRPA